MICALIAAIARARRYMPTVAWEAYGQIDPGIIGMLPSGRIVYPGDTAYPHFTAPSVVQRVGMAVGMAQDKCVTGPVTVRGCAL